MPAIIFSSGLLPIRRPTARGFTRDASGHTGSPKILARLPLFGMEEALERTLSSPEACA